MPELKLLNPPKDCCQESAVKHEPGEPHDSQSFFYRWKFSSENGRSPTWADAMAHCTEEVQQKWITLLVNVGVDINSTNLVGDIKTEEERDKRLANKSPI